MINYFVGIHQLTNLRPDLPTLEQGKQRKRVDGLVIEDFFSKMSVIEYQQIGDSRNLQQYC